MNHHTPIISLAVVLSLRVNSVAQSNPVEANMAKVRQKTHVGIESEFNLEISEINASDIKNIQKLILFSKRFQHHCTESLCCAPGKVKPSKQSSMKAVALSNTTRMTSRVWGAHTTAGSEVKQVETVTAQVYQRPSRKVGVEVRIEQKKDIRKQQVKRSETSKNVVKNSIRQNQLVLPKEPVKKPKEVSKRPKRSLLNIPRNSSKRKPSEFKQTNLTQENFPSRDPSRDRVLNAAETTESLALEDEKPLTETRSGNGVWHEILKAPESVEPVQEAQPEVNSM